MKNAIKIFFFSTLLIFTTNFAKSQPGCPDVDAGPDQALDCITTCTDLTLSPFATGATTGYSVTSIPYSPPYPYNTGTPILVNIDDTWSSAINLPFTFCFFGNSYNKIVAGSNGLVTFDLTTANQYCAWSYTNLCPSPILQMNAIYGVFHDIDPGVAGTMYYALLGTYPCRTFVVSWNQVAMFSTTCNSMLATHQIVLYESTNVIEVYVQSAPLCSSWNSGNKCIGIQNSTGSIGYTPPGRNTGAWSATNEAWRFTPDGTPNYTISWWQGGTQISTDTTINVCPPVTTTYTAQVVYDCCTGTQVTVTDDVVVNVNGSIGLSINPANPTICDGGSSTLTATSTDPSATFQWSTGSSNSVITVNPSTTTTYTVTATTPGCTSQASVDVTVSTNPVVLVNSTTICNGQPTTISASGATSYLWNTGSTNSSITVTPTSTTTYTVTGTNSGCTGTGSGIVTVNPLPNAQVSSISVCGNNSGSATATGGTSYLWSNGMTSPTITGLPTGTYTVTVTNNGCTSTASTTITNFPLPSVSISNIISATCSNADGSATALATNGTPQYNYLWNCSPMQNSQSMINVVSGNYIVSVTDLNGCTATNTATVPGTQNPTATTTTTNEICGQTNGSATVIPSGGSGNYTYNWSTGANTPSISNLATGSYSVTVTDANGCTAYTSANIMETPGPVADFSAHPNVLTTMDGTATFFDNSSGTIVNWQWNFGDGSPNGSGEILNHYYDNIGIYLITLIVTDNNGCSDTTTDTLKLKDIVTFYAPNSFTPNGNGLNDYFLPLGINWDPDYYEMYIFDRWGNLVFQSRTIGERWYGTVRNKRTQEDVFEDVYIYLIRIKELEGPKHEYKGSITLIR